MRFTNQKRNHPFKNIVISVIIFLSVAGLFNYGIQSMSKQSIDEQQTNLETAIERCVSQYYVLVGHYPESLNVLEKEYEGLAGKGSRTFRNHSRNRKSGTDRE